MAEFESHATFRADARQGKISVRLAGELRSYVARFGMTCERRRTGRGHARGLEAEVEAVAIPR